MNESKLRYKFYTQKSKYLSIMRIIKGKIKSLRKKKKIRRRKTNTYKNSKTP
jgi:hypothetical protein